MQPMKIKFGLLAKVLSAIALGIALGFFMPEWFTRIAMTFNSIFGNILNFVIPLLILGLVAPGIAELGTKAGRLLLITVALAYTFTLFSGFGTFFTSLGVLPLLLGNTTANAPAETSESLAPFFTVDMPPVMGVMTALLLAFLLGLGTAYTHGDKLKGILNDFKQIIEFVIAKVIIPLLPFYIFGIFLSITQSGQVASILGIFLKLIIIIFIMTAILLVIQFSIAGIVSKQNPFKMLRTMLTAYITALGTQSSAATIPVTLEQTIKLGVRPEIAGFVVPLCATIHLSGSMMKIIACSMAVMMLTGMNIEIDTYTGFILLLGITMIAAPGVPGGAIMAAIGLLESMLGFDANMVGLMIATYIAMDSFGTATNVTGDGAIAVIVNAIDRRKQQRDERHKKNTN